MSPVLDPPRAGVVGREAELTTIREFVAGISAGPCSLLLEGAVGIGKTTLWRAGVRAAQECSYRVLSCRPRSEEHTSELQSRGHLVCRLLLEKKKQQHNTIIYNC